MSDNLARQYAKILGYAKEFAKEPTLRRRLRQLAAQHLQEAMQVISELEDEGALGGPEQSREEVSRGSHGSFDGFIGGCTALAGQETRSNNPRSLSDRRRTQRRA